MKRQVAQAKQQLSEERSRHTLADRFAELRKLLDEEGYTLGLPERRDRPNAFADAGSA